MLKFGKQKDKDKHNLHITQFNKKIQNIEYVVIRIIY